MIVGIDEQGKALCLRQEFVQEPEPLRSEFRVDKADTCDVASRPVQAGNETRFDWVAAYAEDDRNLVAVAALAAATAKVPPAAWIAATSRRTNSAARAGSRSL